MPDYSFKSWQRDRREVLAEMADFAARFPGYDDAYRRAFLSSLDQEFHSQRLVLKKV